MNSNCTMCVPERDPSESRVGPASTSCTLTSALMCCRWSLYCRHCQHTADRGRGFSHSKLVKND